MNNKTIKKGGEKMSKSTVFGVVVLVLAILYFVWQLGRAYGQTEVTSLYAGQLSNLDYQVQKIETQDRIILKNCLLKLRSYEAQGI